MRRQHLLISSLALLGLAACGDDDEGSGSVCETLVRARCENGIRCQSGGPPNPSDVTACITQQSANLGGSGIACAQVQGTTSRYDQCLASVSGTQCVSSAEEAAACGSSSDPSQVFQLSSTSPGSGGIAPTPAPGPGGAPAPGGQPSSCTPVAVAYCNDEANDCGNFSSTQACLDQIPELCGATSPNDQACAEALNQPGCLSLEDFESICL